ncbi:MAG: hypothetical protein KF810_13090 [Rhizobiaceae bacterium]|nr:hypothetical protein [Rhizobiaceae bacterium]
MMETIWTHEDNTQLEAILDLLIPANIERGIPGAGEARVASYLSVVASRNAKFAGQVRTLLASVSGTIHDITPEKMHQLETTVPDAFRALLTETYKGYYSRPDMRAHVGVGIHPVHPNGYAVLPEDPALLDELTAPVRARGTVFRDPTAKETG